MAKKTLSPEKEKEVTQYLLDCIKFYETQSKDINKNVQEYWDRHFGTYSCKKDKNFPFVGAADIQTGIISYSDSAIEARFRAALNTIKLIRIDASSTAGRIAAKHIEDFLTEYWIPQIKPENELVDYFQNDVVEGTAFLQIEPIKETKKVKRYKLIERVLNFVKKLIGYEKGEDGKILIDEIEHDKYIGCKWKTIPSIEEVGFDISAGNIQECDWFYKNIYRTDREIRLNEKKKGWINIDKIFVGEPDKKNKSPLESTGSSILLNETADETKKDYSGFNQTYINKKKFVEFVANYDINDDGEDEHCYFIIYPEKELLVYYNDNEFFDKRKPYVATQFYRISGQIIGQGQPQRLASLNDEMDILQDQIIDNTTLQNSLTGFFIPSRDLDPDKIEISPGRLSPVSSFKSIQLEKFGNSQLNLERQQATVLGLLERKSLVADYSLGRESQINKQPTAQGTAMILKEFSINLDPLMQNLQNSLKEAVYQTLMCFYETMPEEGVEYTINDDTKIFKREYLEYIDELKISVLEGATSVMADSERQIATIIMQALGQDQTGEIDTFAVKRNWLEKLDPILAKEIIREPQEVQMINEIKQKAIELLQKEEILNQQMAEIEKIKQGLVIEEGKKGEQEFENKLNGMAVSPEEKQRMLTEYRSKFIEKKLGGENAPEKP